MNKVQFEQLIEKIGRITSLLAVIEGMMDEVRKEMRLDRMDEKPKVQEQPKVYSRPRLYMGEMKRVLQILEEDCQVDLCEFKVKVIGDAFNRMMGTEFKYQKIGRIIRSLEGLGIQRYRIGYVVSWKKGQFSESEER